MNNNCIFKCPMTDSNSYDVMISQLKTEILSLSNSTKAQLLKQENKINEIHTLIKENLSDTLRAYFNEMLYNGELDKLITEVLLNDVKLLNEKTADIVSIKEFGAVGSGQCDDTIAIQSAIDYAIKNNKSVYIPAGKFKITRPLTLSDTVNMYGDGQSSQNTGKSMILLSCGDKGYPLIEAADGVTQLGRCTFSNITFTRSRTCADGYNKDTAPMAYGKSSVCIDFNLNESSFNRCTFIGFGAVCSKASITDFIDCDIVYCNHILKNTVLCNAVSFYGCNVYACGTLLSAYGNLSTVNFTNCWIEDFETLLETKGTSILGLNFSGCTLTNTANGKELIVFTAKPTFAREFIIFTDCLLYFKTTLCSTRPNTVEFSTTFNNSVIYYGGEGETIPIYGNSKWLTLSGSNTDIVSTNSGFDTRSCKAYSPIHLSNASAEVWALSKPNVFIETRDDNENRMIMLPVYYEFVQNPSLSRYFVFNTQAVSTGDWVLKFVYKADSGTIEKTIVTL